MTQILMGLFVMHVHGHHIVVAEHKTQHFEFALDPVEFAFRHLCRSRWGFKEFLHQLQGSEVVFPHPLFIKLDTHGDDHQGMP